MYLMSTSMVHYTSFIRHHGSVSQRKFRACRASSCTNSFPFERRRVLRLVPNAKRKWWSKFFSDVDDEGWFNWTAKDVLGDSDGSDGDDGGEGKSEEEKFEAWKRRAQAISELREAQEDANNAEGRRWEDWLEVGETNASSWDQDWGERVETSSEVSDDLDELISEKGIVEAIKNFIVRNDDDELLFEDRVFRYASTSSAKFVAFLILIPWALDFLLHDYVLMPFLDRYVKTVPLAAEMLDVRKKQKLEMVKTLKIERARFRLEVEIGKSPPLSDEETWLELRHKAIKR